jgi:tRNA A-37 threonylcarbamoyl transferase component Bud32
MSGTGRRYRVVEAVGRGGFGTVYRAEMVGDGGFTKQVALKILNHEASQSDEMARRLRDEARVLGLVRHRAVVGVDGLVRLDGRWTVVMEYVEGVDLRAVISIGAAPLGAAMELVAEVASALDVAWHQAGPDGRPLRLLHRDIKPSNIQVTAAGEVKVLDFGIARADVEREAETRDLTFGSVGYLSPERLDFIDGPEGDVYGLGVVLSELLSGSVFGRTSGQPERHRARVIRAQADLRSLGPGSELAVELIGNMLAYDPADRPTAREVERTARMIQREVGGASLRDWAERAVPIVARSRPALDAGELSGTILVEAGVADDLSGERRLTGGRKLPAPAPAPMRSYGLALVVLGALAAGSALIGLAFAGYAAWLSASEAPSLPAQATAPVAATGPLVVEGSRRKNPTNADAATVLAADDAPVVPSTSETSPSTRSATTRANSNPTEAPVVSTAAVDGSVRVTGDAASVSLVGADGRAYGPGPVPAGSYSVQADFGAGPLASGTVQVKAGGSVVLSCSAAFGMCKVR